MPVRYKNMPHFRENFKRGFIGGVCVCALALVCEVKRQAEDAVDLVAGVSVRYAAIFSGKPSVKLLFIGLLAAFKLEKILRNGLRVNIAVLVPINACPLPAPLRNGDR